MKILEELDRLVEETPNRKSPSNLLKRLDGLVESEDKQKKDERASASSDSKLLSGLDELVKHKPRKKIDYSKESMPGIDNLKKLPRDVGELLLDEVNEAVEDPAGYFLTSGPMNPLRYAEAAGKEALKEIAKLSDSRELWKYVTGHDWMDEEDIAKLPPEKQREVIRRQQSALENLGSDLVELKGLAALPVAAAEGIAAMPERYKQSKDSGSSVGEALWDSTAGARDVAADIVAKSSKSLVKSLVDPEEAFRDSPLEHVTNVAGGASTVLRLTKGAGVANKTLQAARPSKVIQDVADKVVQDNPALIKPVQLLVDRQAGTGTARAVLDSQRSQTVGTLLSRLDELAGSGLHKLPKKDRARLVRELGGERAKDAVPDLVEKRYLLSDDIDSLRKVPVLEPDEITVALRNPARLDALRSKYLGKKDSLAQEVDNARVFYDVDFVVDGVPMTSIEFIASRKPIDPRKIDVVVRDGADPLLAERAKATLLPIRQVLTEIGEEAAKIDLGIGDRKMLARRTQSVHAGSYFPERRLKGGPDEELAAYLDVVIPGANADDLGHLQRAVPKHKLTQRERQARGALGPEEGYEALLDYVYKATVGEMKFKTYDVLSKKWAIRESELASTMRSVGIRSSGKNRVVLKNGKRFIKVPEDNIPGYDVPRYGALAGKWIDEALWRNVRNTDTEFKKQYKRFVGNWKAGHVASNFPSHLNQAFGNVLGNLVEGSMPSDFINAAKALRNKNDPLYRSAVKAGILGSDTHLGQLQTKITPELGRNPVGFLAKVANKFLDAHEYVNVRNPVSKKMMAFWEMSDNFSKLTHLNRFVRQKAKELGLSRREVLQRSELMDEARKMLEDTWHPTYQNSPELLTIMDTYGVMPFSRYAYKITSNVVDSHVTHPVKMGLVHQAERARYDTASEEDRRRMDSQASWYMGRGVPVDNLAGMFGASGSYDFNTRWLNPVPVPEEILSLGRGGSFGSDLYREAFPGVEDYIPKGLTVGLPYEMVTGKTLEFGSDLEGIAGRLDYFVQQMMPGAYYHLVKKIGPAVLGIKDQRGREMDPVVAGMHALGVKVEESRMRDVEQWIRQGAQAAKKDAYRELSKSLRRAKTNEEKEAAYKKYDWRLKKIEQIRLRLLRQHG